MAFVECVLGPAEGVEEPGFATRGCSEIGEWLPSNLDNCLTIVSFLLQSLGRVRQYLLELMH